MNMAGLPAAMGGGPATAAMTGGPLMADTGMGGAAATWPGITGPAPGPNDDAELAVVAAAEMVALLDPVPLVA